MEIRWNSVVEGIAAGVAASVLLAIFVIARDLVRNALLKWQLTRQFRNLEMGTGIDGITLHLRNHLGTSFTIRNVVLVTEKATYRFSPTGEVSNSPKEPHPKPTWQQMHLLKTGKIDSIQLGAEFEFKTWKSSPTPAGFVEAEPFTRHKFLLPARIFADFESLISGIRITIQYQTRTQTAKLLTVEANDSVAHLRAVVEHFREDIRNGSLDRARAMFHLPPVNSPATAIRPDTDPVSEGEL